MIAGVLVDLEKVWEALDRANSPRKLCQFDDRLEPNRLSKGDVLTNEVFATISGFLEAEEAPVQPETKERGIHQIDQVGSATILAPGLSPERFDVNSKVKFGETERIGIIGLHAESVGQKKLFLHPQTYDTTYLSIGVEVRKSHLGLPLWAETWAPKIDYFLGPVLTMP